MAHHGLVLALQPGTMLCNGRYKIERELNRGGTAVVYAADDLSTGGRVALKVMNGPGQVPVKVVKREIAFSAQARHENIVRLLDVFADRTQLVIVWELIIGPDLLDLLNECNGSMTEPLACFFFCQLLQAVLFMHAHGYCHRDIKPENCMVDRCNQKLKLIDFGLSKHLESAVTRGVGTPDYLSPEMLQVWTSYGGVDAAPYDARAVDAWAMGVMMFLLCTGRYPFEDPAHPNNLPHTIQNVLMGHMRPFPENMSQGCRRLISNLLKVDPAQRTTLQDLAKDEWLVGQAKAQAASIGRPDLLGPLATLSLASADSGISSGSSGRGGDVGLQTVPSGVPLGAQQADHAQVHHAAVAATPNSAHLAPAVYHGWPSGSQPPRLPETGPLTSASSGSVLSGEEAGDSSKLASASGKSGSGAFGRAITFLKSMRKGPSGREN